MAEISGDASTRLAAERRVRPGSSRGFGWALAVVVLVAAAAWVWWTEFALSTQQSYQLVYRHGAVSDPVPGAGTRGHEASGLRLRTGADGFATLRMSGGSEIRLLPGTELMIKEARASRDGSRVLTTMRLLSGSLAARTTYPPDHRGELRLLSEHLAMDARGGAFDLASDGAGARLAVHAGVVEVKGKRGAAVQVVAGQGTFVPAGAAARAPLALPPAPSLPDPATAFSVAAGAGIAFGWETVDGAHEYVLELAADRAFERALRRERAVRARWSTAPLARDGEFYWRVASVGRNGVQGAFSEARKFFHDYYLVTARAALARLDVDAVRANVSRTVGGIEPELDALRTRGFRDLTAGRFGAARAAFATVLALRADDGAARNGLDLSSALLLGAQRRATRIQ